MLKVQQARHLKQIIGSNGLGRDERLEQYLAGKNRRRIPSTLPPKQVNCAPADEVRNLATQPASVTRYHQIGGSNARREERKTNGAPKSNYHSRKWSDCRSRFPIVSTVNFFCYEFGTRIENAADN